jgi:hypothetical protein
MKTSVLTRAPYCLFNIILVLVYPWREMEVANTSRFAEAASKEKFMQQKRSVSCLFTFQ